MEQIKRWEEIDVTQLGLLLMQAFNNLDRGEDGEFDLELGGRSLRLVNDSINRRVVIFELSNMMEQRKWQWEDGLPERGVELLDSQDEGTDKSSLR